MNSPLKSLSAMLIKLAAAVAASFLFFIAISSLHSMFGTAFVGEKPPSGQRVIAEMVARPPEKKKEERVHVRRVQAAARDGRQAGDMQMSMKFMPDLSVDEGGEGGVVLQSQDLQAEVFEEGETDEPFAAVYTPPLAYPERARELGVEGTLVVDFIIDHRGRVSSFNIAKSPHPSITAEARRLIPTWRFKPAKNKGVPVNMHVKQEIEFQIE